MNGADQKNGAHQMNDGDPRVIVGDALIVGVDGEEFTDLTDYQVHWIQVMGHPFVEWEEEEA